MLQTDRQTDRQTDMERETDRQTDRQTDIQNHIPVKLRDDLMLNTVEVIWLQDHLPHLKPILVKLL